MRQSHSHMSLASLCSLFGVTRQAFYDAQQHDNKNSIANMIVLALVNEIRDDIPMIGTRKLFFMLTSPQIIGPA